MCLATAYVRAAETEETVCENVARVDVDGLAVTITDRMNRKTVINGKLKTIDMENGIILIEGLLFT